MPNRILREGLRTSETINSVSFGAECMYVHLLTCVDDFGRMEYIPRAFKAEVFPARDVRDADVTRLLSELEEAGAVRRYDYNSKRFIVLSKVDVPRAKGSKCPQPPSGYECWREDGKDGATYGIEHTGFDSCKHLHADACRCKQTQADAGNRTVFVSVSGSVFEQKKNPPANAGPLQGARARREQFVKPTVAEVAEYMHQRGWRDWERMASKWVDHYQKQGWVCGKARAPMKDWRAAVRTWEGGDDVVIERRYAGVEYYDAPCALCGEPGRGEIQQDGKRLIAMCQKCHGEMERELAS